MMSQPTLVVLTLFIVFWMSFCSFTLSSPYTCSLQYGTYTSNEPWLDDHMATTAQIDNQIQRSSTFVHWYPSWGDGSGSWQNNVKHFLNVALNFTSGENTDPYNHVPLLSWQPWGPHFQVSTPEFPLASIANGTYDSYIDTWVAGIRNVNYTVWLRPMHEMDGDWYPWGNVSSNTPALYIAAWRRIYSRFQGVKNVKFVWCPNNSNKAGTDQRVYYPGDEYVDWIGLDAYSSSGGGFANFSKTITTNCNPPQPYGRLTNMTSKPMMMAEFGTLEPGSGAGVGASKGQWFRQMAVDLESMFPRIQALVYFNSQGYNYSSSADSIQGAKDAFGGCAVTSSSKSSSSSVSLTSSRTVALASAASATPSLSFGASPSNTASKSTTPSITASRSLSSTRSTSLSSSSTSSKSVGLFTSATPSSSTPTVGSRQNPVVSTLNVSPSNGAILVSWISVFFNLNLF